MHYASGKTLGGSSGRNYMLYHKGSIGSCQVWADDVGDQSYTWPNILQYFQKGVAVTPPSISTRLSNATVAYDQSLPNNNESSGGHELPVSWVNYAPASVTFAQQAMAAVG